MAEQPEQEFAPKAYGNLTLDQLRSLLIVAPELLEQAEKLLEQVGASGKGKKLIAEAPHRGRFYEIPLAQLISSFVVASGTGELLNEATIAEDPQGAVISAFIDKTPSLSVDSSEETEAALLQMVLAIAFSLRCTAIHGRSLYSLLSSSAENTKCLFDAVLIDQACLANTIAGSVMDLHRASPDFQRRLGRAAGGRSFKRKSPQLDLPRLALALLHDGGALVTMTNDDLHDLLVYRLKLEPYASSEDAFDAIAKLRQRITL